MRKYFAFALALLLLSSFALPTYAETESEEEPKRVIPDLIEEVEQIEPDLYDIYFYPEEDLSYMLEVIANLINKNNYLLEINNQNDDLTNIRLHNQIVYTLHQLEELEKQQEQLTEMYELLYQELVENKELTLTEVETAHGLIAINHNLTLGEMILLIGLGLLIITIVLKWLISRIWG